MLALGEDDSLLFNSGDYEPDKDIGALMLQALEKTQRSVGEIRRIVADIGPGGTSRVRTGVSFANGLAFSLGIGVCPVSLFELIGILLWKRHQLPVVSTINSLKGNAYIGFFDQGVLQPTRFGFIDQILPEMLISLDAFTVAGPHSAAIQALFPDKKIVSDNELTGIAQVMIEHSSEWAGRELKFPHVALPITEKQFL